MCDNFEELSETYFRFSVALVEAEFGFLTKLNDSTTMKGKCYDDNYLVPKIALKMLENKSQHLT